MKYLNTSYRLFIIVVICSFFNIKSFSWQDIKDFFVPTVSTVQPLTVQFPKTMSELQQIIKSANSPIAIVGAGYSQGDQTKYPQATVLDISLLNKIISFDEQQKKITVQAGISWKKIQEYIDSFNLSVRVMQSYNDFSVGGSLSVNVHGRDIHEGALIQSVESIKIITADGIVQYADRTIHKDLFYGAIGGYGLLGIIVEATLLLTDNISLQLQEVTIPRSIYVSFFENYIHKHPQAVFHNGLIMPPYFDEVRCDTWYNHIFTPTTQKGLRLHQDFYPQEIILQQLLTRSPLVQKFRPNIEQVINPSNQCAMRNYEMSYSVQGLTMPIKQFSSYILQEYFVPKDRLEEFLSLATDIIKKYAINILNISLRYIPADKESLFNYSRQESFACVMYINVWNTQTANQEAQQWTQELINAALTCGGTYYLPYRLYATKEQFLKAYPQWPQFLELKKKYDPTNKFRNMLYQKYGEE